MKTRTIILSLVAVLGALCAAGQNSDAVVRDKMTSAVMKVYDEHLAQNPNDYNILFARAHQHYYNGEYTAALADVNQAMLITPKTEKELRCAVCGKRFDTPEDARKHEQWHSDKREAKRQRYFERCEAKRRIAEKEREERISKYMKDLAK